MSALSVELRCVTDVRSTVVRTPLYNTMDCTCIHEIVNESCLERPRKNRAAQSLVRSAQCSQVYLGTSLARGDVVYLHRGGNISLRPEIQRDCCLQACAETIHAARISRERKPSKIANSPPLASVVCPTLDRPREEGTCASQPRAPRR